MKIKHLSTSLTDICLLLTIQLIGRENTIYTVVKITEKELYLTTNGHSGYSNL